LLKNLKEKLKRFDSSTVISFLYSPLHPV